MSRHNRDDGDRGRQAIAQGEGEHPDLALHHAVVDDNDEVEEEEALAEHPEEERQEAEVRQER